MKTLVDTSAWMVEGSRDAYLKSENNGDGGSDWDSHKIGHGTY